MRHLEATRWRGLWVPESPPGAEPSSSAAQPGTAALSKEEGFAGPGPDTPGSACSGRQAGQPDDYSLVKSEWGAACSQKVLTQVIREGPQRSGPPSQSRAWFACFGLCLRKPLAFHGLEPTSRGHAPPLLGRFLLSPAPPTVPNRFTSFPPSFSPSLPPSLPSGM